MKRNIRNTPNRKEDMQQIHAHNEDRKVLKKLKLYRKVKLASDVNPNYIKHSTIPLP